VNISDQFWVSIGVEAVIGIAVLAMMKQQLRDLVGWVKRHDKDIDDLHAGHTDHEGRISHVEGRLNINRTGN
jgi:hypothetical protein